MANTEQECSTLTSLRRWQDGDVEGFRELHARLTPLLRVRIRNHPSMAVLAHKVPVDDILQEAWGRAVPAVQKNYTYTGSGSLFAFVGTIADRIVMGLARAQMTEKRGNEQRIGTEFDAPDCASPGHAFLPSATGNARAGELMSIARAVLTDREFDAWHLFAVCDYSADEVGLALRCSGAAVRGLALRAREKLVQRLNRTLPVTEANA